MIYVTSDLHGCPPGEFLALLESAGFCERDFLFVLGDVIDRGEHGVELLRWISRQSNVQLLLGNHEAMLLACRFIFDEITDESLARLGTKQLQLLSNWLGNGAQPTLTGLRALKKTDPDVLDGILDCLGDATLFEELTVGGRRFVLVHSGIENFDPQKPLGDYSPDELIWARPDLQTRYYDDATVVFGHTPTYHFGEQYRGRILHANGWICIDTGAACGGSPALLRLDDMREFYR